MKKRLALFLIPVLFGGQKALSQTRIYVNEYLNIGVGARGLAMAGAQSATSNDVMSGYWNPAGLMRVEDDLQVGLMHAEYFSGISKYDFGSIVKPLKDKKRVVGFSVLRFATDDIANTIDLVQPDGSIDESKIKSMSAGDYAFLLSYAQKLNIFKKNPEIHTNIGANAKIIYRNLSSLANAWGVGVDVGLQTTYKQWYFGLMAKDITTTYTSWSFNLSEHDKQVFGATGNEIPVKSYEVMLPRFNFGVARDLLKPTGKFQVMAEIDADLTTDGKRNTLISSSGFSIDPHMGVEASYKHTIYLRAGVGNIQRVLDDRDTTNQQKYTLFQPTVGVGIKLKAIVVDYAFTSLQTQSNPLYTHIVSLRINVNPASKKKKESSGEEMPAPQIKE